jgi:hypothetical protein
MPSGLYTFNWLVVRDPAGTEQAERWYLFFMASDAQITDIRHGIWKALAPSKAFQFDGEGVMIAQVL